MRALILIAAVFLSACNDEGKSAASAPPPSAVTAEAVGHFCGMQLTEHEGPKGQIFLVGKARPIWFSSARDAIAFMRLPDEPKAVAAIYVSDMGAAKNWAHPRVWVDARKAYFVIGSGKRGGMGAAEAVPFGGKDAAEAFAAAEGGRIVGLDGVPNAYVLGSGGMDAMKSDAGAVRETRSKVEAGHDAQ
jgi:copper chaperone NosL